jgi:hypothetical protein
MLHRLIFSTGGVISSLVLGAVAMAMVGIYYPETLSIMLGWARSLKSYLTSTGLAAKYNIWLELLLEERQLLYAFFTIATRIVLSVVFGGLVSLLWRADTR